MQEKSIPVTITGHNNLQSFIDAVQLAAKEKVGFILYEGFTSRDPIELAQILGSLGITHRSLVLMDASQLEINKKIQSFQRAVDVADIVVLTETDTMNDSTSMVTNIRNEMNYTGIAFPYSQDTMQGVV